MVVIEHHTELLEICDRLVELGPEGGEAGGAIIAEGSPETLASAKTSVTGPWLFGGRGSSERGRASGRRTRPSRKPRAAKTASRKKSSRTRRASS